LQFAICNSSKYHDIMSWHEPWAWSEVRRTILHDARRRRFRTSSAFKLKYVLRNLWK
jgi:hypothetical protein